MGIAYSTPSRKGVEEAISISDHLQFDGSDGGALRIDVADFMDQEAINQPGSEF